MQRLYSEEVRPDYKESSSPAKKPGWFRKALAGAAISIPLFFGLIDKDYIGPKEAHAAGKGYISVAFCPTTPEPSQPYYYKLFVTRQDNWQIKEINIPSSRLRYNITGLDEGILYEVKAQTCFNEQECSADSANKPLGTARLYGNADSSSVPGTVNRVDSYDSSKCYSVYTGRITDPDSRQICDFSGNYNPDMTDYNYYLRPNIGKVQANPLGTVYEDCSGGRCPEIGTCSQPY
ncbi:MAG: fibronectin type III domain-containing protein [Candidatus Aenigmarchaeota archaeon]|nr:fibronectin type III domain-containing protein [Candidatus Aenigmarchaeota archaeon]